MHQKVLDHSNSGPGPNGQHSWGMGSSNFSVPCWAQNRQWEGYRHQLPAWLIGGALLGQYLVPKSDQNHPVVLQALEFDDQGLPGACLQGVRFQQSKKTVLNLRTFK
jgi:hypothetical protein